METCANCDRTIGKLETGHLIQGTIVCGECHGLLTAQAGTAAQVEPPPAPLPAAGSRRGQARPDAPTYGLASIISALFVVLGLISIVAGVVIFVGSMGDSPAAVAEVGRGVWGSPPPQRGNNGAWAILGLAALFNGLFLIAIGAAIDMLRDSALLLFGLYHYRG